LVVTTNNIKLEHIRHMKADNNNNNNNNKIAF